jgi:hypothetical protein
MQFKIGTFLGIGIILMTSAQAESLRVGISVDGGSVRLRTKIRDSFVSELEKIPDVLVVNQGHHDLDVNVTAIAGPDGVFAYTVSVWDYDQISMALGDNGFDVAKILTVLRDRGILHLRACLFDELKLGGIANVCESVAADVTG